MKLRVTNWKKHNAKRKDVKTNTWYKVNNDLLERPDMLELTNTEVVVWLFILSSRARSPSDDFLLSRKLGLFFCKCDDTEFDVALEKLKSFEMIDIIDDTSRVRNEDVTDTSRVCNEDVKNTCPQIRLDKIRLEKKYKPPRSSREPLSIEWLNFGQSWLEFGLRHTKVKKPHASWTAENFGSELAKVSRSTGLTLDQLLEAMKWADTDDFWQHQILSPAGLLKLSENGNRKVDNLFKAFHKSKNGGKPPSKSIDSLYQNLTKLGD